MGSRSFMFSDGSVGKSAERKRKKSKDTQKPLRSLQNIIIHGKNRIVAN